jgi:predicted dehydrogenase
MKRFNSHRITRRRFLHGTGTSLALFHLIPKSLARGVERLSANEKVNVAGIGIGSQGSADVNEMARLGHNIVALCDVDENYASKGFAKYPNARRFTDYRVMLDKLRGAVDAVVIGTPDHTHAVTAMEAMLHGKHVYCEKPLAHSIEEVRKLMAAAGKYKVVTQLGNQGHSSGSIRQLCEWVWAGAIGPIHTVHAGCDSKNYYSQIANLAKLNQHYDVPPGLNYDLWVGPAPFRPYTPFWIPRTWRAWLPFGTGAIGDWFCHVVDPSFWALDLVAPATVRAEVTDYDPSTQGLTYPPGAKITFEFPARNARGPVKLVWYDGNNSISRPAGFSPDDKVPGTGAILFGEKGMIVHGSHGAGGCYITPEKLMDEHSGKNAPPQQIPRVQGHAWDWIEAIRSGRQAGSNFGYGGPLTQAALLGLIAIRFPGETLYWDDQQMRFTNHEAANAFAAPAYRSGWKL